jgi:SAM-dependent methyltransferase
MWERFQQLSRFVASEEDAGDAGTLLSLSTIMAYHQLVDLYDRAIEPWIAVADDASRANFLPIRGYIEDYHRTIYMIRAMCRSITAHEQSRLSGPIRVVEAGCGSGFLAAVALALSKRVVGEAYDALPVMIDATTQLLGSLGQLERTRVVVRDLIRDGVPGRVDTLVAEHLVPGLFEEPCIQIPRAVEDIDPVHVIPFAVLPAVFLYAGGEHTQVDRGKRVVLADKNGLDHFTVHGQLPIQGKRLVSINVGNDIWWAENSKYQPLYQSSTVRERGVEYPHNHLLGFVPLRPHKDSDDRYALGNSAHECRQVYYTVDYPLGGRNDSHQMQPQFILANGETILTNTRFCYDYLPVVG